MRGLPGKLGLAAASLLLTYAVLELGLFRWLVTALPLRLHVYLDDDARLLAQSSKRAALPERYVALVGDSHAQGRGDWLLAADPDRNGPFASAHVLHERSGRDVVSFGRGGAGSLTGLLAYPALSMRLAGSRLYPLTPPDDLVVYFYEGNDLRDTLLELMQLVVGEGEGASASPEQRIRAAADAMVADEPDYFRRITGDPRLRRGPALDALVAEVLLPTFGLDRDVDTAPREELRLARFLGRLLSDDLGRGEDPPWLEASFETRGETPVRVGGERVVLPGYLQGPALALTPPERQLALLVFGHALRGLRNRFPDARTCVVYVPAPLSCYALVEPVVTAEPLRTRPHRHAVAEVARTSDVIARRVRLLSGRAGARFVDARPALREAARTAVIHGPRDWRHPNRAGYTALAEAALACLPEAPEEEPPG